MGVLVGVGVIVGVGVSNHTVTSLEPGTTVDHQRMHSSVCATNMNWLVCSRITVMQLSNLTTHTSEKD